MWKITPTKDRRSETAVPCWIVHPEGTDDQQGILCYREDQATLVCDALNGWSASVPTATSDNGLLGCPFCGSKAEVDYDDGQKDVKCQNLDCFMSFGAHRFVDEKEWNTRSTPPGWKPISCAPKDEKVLCYEDGDYYAGELQDGRYWTASCGQTVIMPPEPTHWQPLPEPPKGGTTNPQPTKEN